jgi:hypothetical protein
MYYEGRQRPTSRQFIFDRGLRSLPPRHVTTTAVSRCAVSLAAYQRRKCGKPRTVTRTSCEMNGKSIKTASKTSSGPGSAGALRLAGVGMIAVPGYKGGLATGFLVSPCHGIRETVAKLEAAAESTPPSISVALKVARPLSDLETYVSGQLDIIIDYAPARRRVEPISTAPTESPVQWLPHPLVNAKRQMRWTPPGAHLMLKVRCALTSSTLEQDHAFADRWARGRQGPGRSTLRTNPEPPMRETASRCRMGAGGPAK